MARNARGRPRKRGSKQGEVVEVVNGFELKPSSYQPSKAELEADIERFSRAPWKGAILQRVRIPPGNCRSSR